MRSKKARLTDDELKFTENEIVLFKALFGDYIVPRASKKNTKRTRTPHRSPDREQYPAAFLEDEINAEKRNKR
jgi:hypothetical protein